MFKQRHIDSNTLAIGVGLCWALQESLELGTPGDSGLGAPGVSGVGQFRENVGLDSGPGRLWGWALRESLGVDRRGEEFRARRRVESKI